MYHLCQILMIVLLKIKLGKEYRFLKATAEQDDNGLCAELTAKSIFVMKYFFNIENPASEIIPRCITAKCYTYIMFYISWRLIDTEKKLGFQLMS